MIVQATIQTSMKKSDENAKLSTENRDAETYMVMDEADARVRTQPKRGKAKDRI